MRRTLLLLALLHLLAGCAGPPAPTAPVELSASASSAPIGQPSLATSLTCTLSAQDCADARRAVEASAVDAGGMPPFAVQIVATTECRIVTGGPKGWDACSAAINPPPGDANASGSGDALATVTYRGGLGKAFLYLWWWISPTGRGPVNAVLETHNP